jgi:hypothetical protein
MAKIPSFQRLIKEDAKEEDQAVIEKVGYSVNAFAEQMLNAMNKNITVNDNLNMEYKTIDVTTNSNGDVPSNTEFKSGLRIKLKGMQVIRVENLSNPSLSMQSSPFVDFSEKNFIVNISNITGLRVNTKYRITLLTFGS